MAKLSLNSISPEVFLVCENDQTKERNEIISEGRKLFYEHARKGQRALYKAMQRSDAPDTGDGLNAGQYQKLNELFRKEHLLYAAKRCCAISGKNAPESFEEFRKQGMNFAQNEMFYKVLQGVYEDIVNPILPAVYSEAVDVFADVVEVGFGETAQITIGSNDIPIFQDSAWGASRSVPANRFYARDFTLNPQPKTAEIRVKWHQLVGNGFDFGELMANIVAGLYAKTMGLWSAMMTAAANNQTLIPSGMKYSFTALNWARATNKMMAVNNIGKENIIAFGNLVALAKVLPNESTGTTNVTMDAALATLLGRDYVGRGYLGEYMGVSLRPLRDAVVPGTQNTSVTTILDEHSIWMLATNRRKPATIAYNSATPISIGIEPLNSGSSFEMGINLTIALDMVATFAAREALITV